jgi:hypothetical protein
MGYPKGHLPIIRLLRCLITTPAVAETIETIALLEVDVRSVARAVSPRHPLPLGLTLRGGELIRGQRSRDGVAPVGRGQSVVRIYDTEGRREGTNHPARSVWLARIFFDTLDENVIRRCCLFKLQKDLVGQVAVQKASERRSIGNLGSI